MLKDFLIIENEEELEEKLENFITVMFGQDMSDKITTNVEILTDAFETPQLLIVQIVFLEYTYKNKLQNKNLESMGFDLKYKGVQPFYIDGKWVTKTVYESLSYMPIQKHNEIYGIGKDKLHDRFNDCIMTC